MKRDWVKLSRAVSHALRHNPQLYDLELDNEGWVSITDLLGALRKRRRVWQDLGEADLAEMMGQSDKRRFEVRDGRMRALYGHSLPARLTREPVAPPAILYHGTTHGALNRIQTEGLRPMRRQHVHLSVDEPTAWQVARRHRGKPIVLVIRAAEAHAAGVSFYQGGESVWLADHIPPQFISLP